MGLTFVCPPPPAPCVPGYKIGEQVNTAYSVIFGVWEAVMMFGSIYLLVCLHCSDQVVTSLHKHSLTGALLF
jgi:hypothetical protein